MSEFTRGRKVSSPYGRPIQAAVTPETRKELEELAEAAGLSLAAFIRQILEEYTEEVP